MPVPDLFPAKTVTVAHVWFGDCHAVGCGWTGPNRATFADASEDRRGHLAWHRLKADQTANRDA